MTDPLTLIHVVNEHKLHSNVATVGRLQREKSGMTLLFLNLTQEEKNMLYRGNTSSLRMISLRGKVESSPPMKVVEGS